MCFLPTHVPKNNMPPSRPSLLFLRPTRLLAALFTVHLLATLTALAASPTSKPRRRSPGTSGSRDRDILEELGYVNLLSGRPWFLSSPSTTPSTSTTGSTPRRQNAPTHAHTHKHSQRNRFHPHHLYDDQLPRDHPHHAHASEHSSGEMTQQYTPPQRGRGAVTNNTLLRDAYLAPGMQRRALAGQAGGGARRVPQRGPARGRRGGRGRRKMAGAGVGVEVGVQGAGGERGVVRRHTV